MYVRAAGVGLLGSAIRLPREAGASCAVLLALALLLQLVPLVTIDPGPEDRPRGAVPTPVLSALDVCGDGDKISGRGADHPVLPARTAVLAMAAAPALVLADVSFTLTEGFPRLPLRPPRS